VIEDGNPADSDRLLPMLDRHIATYGKAPRQMAADGGYASVRNLRDAKDRQVQDVVFHKKRGLKIEDRQPRVLGCIASYATSGRVSKPGFPA
jgi:IS5 family transposase